MRRNSKVLKSSDNEVAFNTILPGIFGHKRLPIFFCLSTQVAIVGDM